MAAIGRLNAAIRDLAPLEQMQQEAANVFECLSVPPRPLRRPCLKPSARMPTSRSATLTIWCPVLDPDLSFELIVPISKLRANAVSQSGVIAVRQAELEAIQEGRRLTVENSELSAQLSGAVAALVAASQEGIAAATARTETVQSFGRLGLAAAVALSLISSILIGWLYVGRNVVARLTTVVGWHARPRRRPARHHNSDRLAATRSPKWRSAVEVFRDNAIALDRLLAEREQAAAQLEKVVDERTAELQQRGAVLRVTFDNMAHGVLMFDREQKVAAWNRQVTKLLELPESFLNGKPHFAELHSPPRRTGRVRRRRCRSRSSALYGLRPTASHVRTDASRREVLEIRHNPLPDGEMVIIYTRHDRTQTLRGNAHRCTRSGRSNEPHQVEFPRQYEP